MTEQERIIVRDLAKQVKEGTLKIEQLPPKWQVKVNEVMGEV